MAYKSLTHREATIGRLVHNMVTGVSGFVTHTWPEEVEVRLIGRAPVKNAYGVRAEPREIWPLEKVC